MKKPLADRYTPEFIALAEERRGKLDYVTLHVGQKTGRVNRVCDLLYEMHQNYYFGHFNASCVLGGVFFEQALICLLEEEIQIKGFITCKEGRDIVEVRDSDTLADRSLSTLIKTAGYYKIIPKEHFGLADELRHMRNYLMHDNLGVFIENAEFYEYELAIRYTGANVIKKISIPVKEIQAHCLNIDSQEIWAYYILTRTRHLIEDMFRERVKRLPPDFTVA